MSETETTPVGRLTHDRVRHGKTARDKANGHMPGRKNRKPPGERGHRGGK